MARGILIVDPQCDFINGALPVPGAPAAMDALAKHIEANNGKWAVKIVTNDYHPWEHCSFVDNGGKWPRHCVQHSGGAAIWPPLLPALYETAGSVHILLKGRLKGRDEFSPFYSCADEFAAICAAHAIDALDVCGLAGDVCVLQTLKDGVARHGAGMFNLLAEFAPSLDGGKALAEYSARTWPCDR